LDCGGSAAAFQRFKIKIGGVIDPIGDVKLRPAVSSIPSAMSN
jgi:hypothetical protein